MNMIVKEMKLADANEISLWIYDEPYSLYSMDGSQETVDELMNGAYYTVFNDNNIIGFFCFGESAQVPGGRTEGLYDSADAIDIGLGLRPDLTGKGIGLEFVLVGIDFGIKKYRTGMVRLTVAEFNKRAIRVYEKAGFIMKSSFLNKRNEEEREFLIMMKAV